MTFGDLPGDVLQFLAEKIDTVPHIEALLLLFEQVDQSWTVDLVAARLYVSPAAALGILKDLERRKLVRRAVDAETPIYVYDADWDATGDLMAKVATTYRRSLAPVAAFIHSKASRSVQEFARAFDLKKEQ